MDKVVTFINGDLGMSIIERIANKPELELSLVVINSSQKRSCDYKERLIEFKNALGLRFTVHEWSHKLNSDKDFMEEIAKCKIAISALFGHLIPNDILDTFKDKIINLHPSFLPLGRGSDPIPWGIIEGYKQGASIHTITEELDAGLIVSQQIVDTDLAMNAGEIYEKCMESLLKQFDQVLNAFIDGEIKLTPQEYNEYRTRKSLELKELQVIDASETLNFEIFIRRIQALTFSDGRRPKFRDKQGNIWNIQLKLTKDD